MCIIENSFAKTLASDVASSLPLFHYNGGMLGMNLHKVIIVTLNALQSIEMM